ncbi:hypothetical protein D3C81_2112740 [compost metagenome]
MFSFLIYIILLLTVPPSVLLLKSLVNYITVKALKAWVKGVFNIRISLSGKISSLLPVRCRGKKSIGWNNSRMSHLYSIC